MKAKNRASSRQFSLNAVIHSACTKQIDIDSIFFDCTLPSGERKI